MSLILPVLFFEGVPNLVNFKLKLSETEHNTYSQRYKKYSTGGRETTRNLEAGNSIYLKAVRLDGDYRYITFCVDYIPKI